MWLKTRGMNIKFVYSFNEFGNICHVDAVAL